jgi:hypothetical protein
MLPVISMLAMTIVVSVLGTLGLVAASRRLIRNRDLISGTSDVEGFYITVVGAIYAIFIAFMVFAVWTRFDSATTNVQQESAILVDLYRLAQALPEPLRSQTEQNLRTYAHSVVEDEWPEMRSFRESLTTAKQLNQLWIGLYTLTDLDSPWADDAVTDHLLDQLGELARVRQQRLLQARIGLPQILWWVLIAGAILVSGFSIVFGVENYLAHGLKAIVVTVLIALLLMAIRALDHPFSGPVHISPLPLQTVTERFDECDIGMPVDS